MIAPNHSRWLAVALCTLLSGCGPFFDQMAERRTAYAKAAQGPIVVAVIDDRPGDGYIHGVRLGVKQINASVDRLLGRPIELLVRRGHDDLRKMLPTIRGIAENPTITAVLGHRSSEVAVPASITYEKSQILFMPPFSTSRQLTLHGFDFVLRMMPDDRRMTAQIASLASLFGYKRIAVLHDRSESNRTVAFLFEDAVRRFDIDIPFHGSFFAKDKNYRELIGRLKGEAFDAIFLSTDTRAGARMLRQLRGQGVDKPVLGSDALGSGPLVELAGDAGNRTIVPTVFSPQTTHNSEQKRFIRNYQNSYGKEPEQPAAQGYDSINVIATLIKRRGSTEPRALATAAHFSAPVAGITGIHAYDPAGNIYGKSYSFQVLQFGRWWPLPGVTLPYLLEDFQDVLVADVNAEQTPQLQQANTADPREVTTSADPAKPKQRNPQAGEQPSTMEETLTLNDGKRMEALTRGYRGITEQNQAWLALAHEILKFDRLGLVVTPSAVHDAWLVELARSMARKRGFKLEVCELPLQAPKPEGEALKATDSTAKVMGSNALAIKPTALEKAALLCYSHLARTVDSLLVLPNADLSPDHLKRLNQALLHFGVSTFALQETIKHDYGLTLALVGSGLDLHDPNVALRFNGMLNGIKVHELNEKFSHLPLVAVDLVAAQTLGLFTDPRELTLISEVLDSTPPQPALSLAEETN
jgi:branched-chain amino acid transport system substrate-binding protein